MDVQLSRKRVLHNFEDLLLNISSIENAWHDFMDLGKLPQANVLQPGILESWQHSIEMGLDPYHIEPFPLSSDEINRRIESNQELIEAATPLFESFADQLHHSFFTLDLYDRDLCFIKTYCESNELVKLRRGYSNPGLRRDEAVCGTTAMSLSKQLKKPVRVIGAEHFDIKLHDFICTSVPIFDTDLSLVGVINVVEHCLQSDERTLGIMIALSKGVEYNLRQIRDQRELEITNSLNKAILEAMSDALIVVNSDGLITMTNKAALTLLQPPGNSFEGCMADELFGAGNPINRVLKNKQPIIDKEILLSVAGSTKRYMGTVRPITSSYSTVHGVIGTLKDMGNTRKMIKNFAGWNASFTFDNIIGQNPALLECIQIAEQTVDLNSNTLILGESGTGKEIFAQAIHNASSFRKGPFVAVNCAAIPVGLLESELFGYESGAFTGAKTNGQPGKFELAEEGTIFLDEINSMPLDVQAKILRVVQDKKITRVGGTNCISLHLKIITASNTDLWNMVTKGLFRSDLFYRLNIITIAIPPLRNRIDDIPLLAEYIINRIRSSSGSDVEITPNALKLLAQYSWPGNVRELENVLEQGFVRATIRKSSIIEAEDLHMLHEFLGISASNQEGALSIPPQMEMAKESPLKSSEQSTIRKALSAYDGNISKAAKSLGIARNTLYRKIKEYNISLT